MKGLRGKNVLISGASSGIGRAVAVRMGVEGCNVGINYFSDRANGEETERLMRAAIAADPTEANADVSATIVYADVSKEEDVTRMVDETIAALGGIDILVNNAGFQLEGASHEIPLSKFTNVLNVNLVGAFICAQRAIRHFLAEDKAGIILNMTSVHQIIPKPSYLGYSVSKGGMQNLTRTLALEYADRNIRVNGLGPGATITPINNSWANDKEKKAEVASHIPLGRVAEASEMAGVTAFLCSDEASYITGQTLFVDGGITLFNDFRENWSS